MAGGAARSVSSRSPPAIPSCAGIHDLRTRTSGANDFVQFHVWVDPAMTVREAHDVVDAVEEALEAISPAPRS